MESGNKVVFRRVAWAVIGLLGMAVFFWIFEGVTHERPPLWLQIAVAGGAVGTWLKYGDREVVIPKPNFKRLRFRLSLIAKNVDPYLWIFVAILPLVLLSLPSMIEQGAYRAAIVVGGSAAAANLFTFLLAYLNAKSSPDWK